MKLAPRMIQSMEILQLSTLALEERIEQELAGNPTLELREPGSDAVDLEQQREQTQRDDREGEREIAAGESNSADDFERLDNITEEYGDTWSDNTFDSGESYVPTRRVSSYDGERDAKMDAMANTATRPASLFEQLLDQWRMLELEPNIRRAGEFLIGFLDADGYLRTARQDLMMQCPRDLTEADVDEALTQIQTKLEPLGFGSRDLSECLVIQIDALGAEASNWAIERALVRDHVKDLEQNRLPRIAKSLDVTIDRIKQAIMNLRQFHAHPGRMVVEDVPRTITPDATITYDEEHDRYVAELTNGRTPSLHLSRQYKKMAKDKQVDRKTRDFIGNNLRTGRWLIEAIEQRSATLLRVINVVIAAQREFFDLGPQHLKPLPMTLVADQLGIHVATVSRAVSEKYMETPRGILPLRMFFSGGAETESGESMSWTAIQAKLEQIIAEEDKTKPLNDDQLVEKLKENGIDIARRTVAKYRKQLDIAPARQRREY